MCSDNTVISNIYFSEKFRCFFRNSGVVCIMKNAITVYIDYLGIGKGSILGFTSFLGGFLSFIFGWIHLHLIFHLIINGGLFSMSNGKDSW